MGSKPAGSPTVPPNLGPTPIPDLSTLPLPTPTPVVLPPIGPSISLSARLVAKRDGFATGQTFDIVDCAVVGRSGASPGQLNVDLGAMSEAAYVSARHAEIRYESGRGWLVRDLGSQNGSFVRHAGEVTFHRVVSEENLQNGDEVAFGNARFEFRTL
jgi:hypothetical protein